MINEVFAPGIEFGNNLVMEIKAPRASVKLLEFPSYEEWRRTAKVVKRGHRLIDDISMQNYLKKRESFYNRHVKIIKSFVYKNGKKKEV